MLKLLPDDLINHISLFCSDGDLYSLRSTGFGIDTYKIMKCRNETDFDITNKAITHGSMYLFSKMLSKIYRGDLHRHYIQSIVYEFDPGIYVCHKLIYVDHYERKSLPIYQQGLLVNEKYNVMKQIMDDEIWVDDSLNYQVITYTKLDWGKLLTTNATSRVLTFLHNRRGKFIDSGDNPRIFFNEYSIISHCILHNMVDVFRDICLKYYLDKIDIYQMEEIIYLNHEDTSTEMLVDLLNVKLEILHKFFKYYLKKKDVKGNNFINVFKKIKPIIHKLHDNVRQKFNKIIKIYHEYFWNHLDNKHSLGVIDTINNLNCFIFKPRKYFEITINENQIKGFKYLLKMGLTINKSDLKYIAIHGTFDMFMIASCHLENDKFNVIMGSILVMVVLCMLSLLLSSSRYMKKKYYNEHNNNKLIN
jgi:hypothetical protein